MRAYVYIYIYVCVCVCECVCRAYNYIISMLPHSNQCRIPLQYRLAAYRSVYRPTARCSHPAQCSCLPVCFSLLWCRTMERRRLSGVLLFRTLGQLQHSLSVVLRGVKEHLGPDGSRRRRRQMDRRRWTGQTHQSRRSGQI